MMQLNLWVKLEIKLIFKEVFDMKNVVKKCRNSFSYFKYSNEISINKYINGFLSGMINLVIILDKF
ncbi:hypothetical protein [uncultured Clostridium sp.]|uniref:hypothetical protein n=2 Tax=uncultured Clostridium sp. TaxID=59620 RepID=UPI00272E9D81|nr:hypothetical protein [uncultured Clostridium sp.]